MLDLARVHPVVRSVLQPVLRSTVRSTVRRGAGALCALATLVGAANAQISTTVGPALVPLGAELSITIANDQPFVSGASISWLRVQNAAGQFVYSDTTFELAATFGPHGWITFRYDLTDDQGQPLPPGQYRAFVKADTGAVTTVHRFEIVPEGAGLVFQGTPTIHPPFGGGPGRTFLLQSPADGGLLYFLLAAKTSLVGVPTCNGTFPLDADPLLFLTLTPGALFSDSLGVLDAQGRSELPRFPLPEDASLVGLTLEAAFVVLDPSAPCILRRSSNVVPLTIVG